MDVKYAHPEYKYIPVSKNKLTLVSHVSGDDWRNYREYELSLQAHLRMSLHHDIEC